MIRSDGSFGTSYTNPKALGFDKDCPEHGYTKLAKDKFWENPWTCHWGCRCNNQNERCLIMDELI